MGKRGPKPKPTALKILEGNPGRRPLNDGEPKPAPDVPEPPDHVQGRARELWQDFGSRLASCGLITTVDGQALELLVTTYVQYCDATAAVADRGPVWMDDEYPLKFKVSPHWQRAQALAQRLYTLLREFGMTPSARSTMRASGPVMERPEDPAAEYFTAAS